MTPVVCRSLAPTCAECDPGSSCDSEHAGDRCGYRATTLEGVACKVEREPGKAAVHEIGPGKVLETDRFRVTCAEVVHLKDAWTTSLAYRVDSDYGSVAISGDSAPSDDVVTLAKSVDILFHDCVIPDFCMTADGRFSFKAYHEQKRVLHTSPTQLGALAKRANVGMLVPYHLAPFGSVAAAIDMSRGYYGTHSDAAIWAEFIYAIKQNYAGPIVLAEDLQIFDFETVR